MKSKCGSKKDCWCNRRPEERLKHFMPYLNKMGTARPAVRAAMLSTAPSCVIKLLSECGLNVLKGKIKLEDRQYQKLRPHKRLLLLVSKPNIPLKEKREALIKKKGGFLPAILPVLLSAISGFAGQTLAKAIGIA